MMAAVLRYKIPQFTASHATQEGLPASHNRCYAHSQYFRQLFPTSTWPDNMLLTAVHSVQISSPWHSWFDSKA